MELLRNVTIGQFVPGTSAVHRLDPRCKCLLAVLGVVSTLLLHTPLGNLALLAVCLACIRAAGISIGFALRGLKALVPLMVLSFVFHVGGSRQGPLLLSAGPLVVTQDGVAGASTVCLRLVLLMLITSLLTLTTSPIRLTDAVEHLLRPLRYLGVPTAEIAMMMSIALRFVPTLVETTERLLKAQMARGAAFERGSLVARARALIPVLVPLFVQAFHAAEDLAVAMEARCYRGGEHRSRMVALRTTRADLLVTLAGLVLLAFPIGLDSLCTHRIPVAMAGGVAAR
jgi:energy-coupling factor transport system permease protein